MAISSEVYSLYMNAKLPLPDIAHTYESFSKVKNDPKAISGHLDVYFENLIWNYDADTQDMLREFYYGAEQHVEFFPGLYKTRGEFGATTLDRSKIDDASVDFHVQIDEALANYSDIARKMTLLHEIVGHVGIVQARWLVVGAAQFWGESEVLDQETYRFEELAIALFEKPLYDCIPLSLLIDDLKNIPDDLVRADMLETIVGGQKKSFDNFVGFNGRRLVSGNGEELKAQVVKLLHSREDVKAYISHVQNQNALVR